MSEKFSLDFIYECHCIVGVDMVKQVYESLPPEEQPEFIEALKEYYETKHWKKMPGYIEE